MSQSFQDHPDDDGRLTIASDSHTDEGGPPQVFIETLTESQIETLRDLFSVFDQQRQGYLHPSELRVALRMAECEVSRDEAHAFVATHCANRDKGFTVDEFLGVVDELIRNRPADFRKQYLESVFGAIDVDGAGELDAEKVSKWAASVLEAESAADASVSPDDQQRWRELHSAPDHLDISQLDKDLTSATGIETLMQDLGLGQVNRITKEAFVSLLLQSETLV